MEWIACLEANVNSVNPNTIAVIKSTPKYIPYRASDLFQDKQP